METQKEPLTQEELKFAKLRLDENSLQLMGLKAQLEIATKEIELNLPMRKANENLDNIKTNIEQTKMNAKFYEKQIREGKSVPVNLDKVKEAEE